MTNLSRLQYVKTKVVLKISTEGGRKQKQKENAQTSTGSLEHVDDLMSLETRFTSPERTAISDPIRWLNRCGPLKGKCLKDIKRIYFLTRAVCQRDSFRTLFLSLSNQLTTSLEVRLIGSKNRTTKNETRDAAFPRNKKILLSNEMTENYYPERYQPGYIPRIRQKRWTSLFKARCLGQTFPSTDRAQSYLELREKTASPLKPVRR